MLGSTICGQWDKGQGKCNAHCLTCHREGPCFQRICYKSNAGRACFICIYGEKWSASGFGIDGASMGYLISASGGLLQAVKMPLVSWGNCLSDGAFGDMGLHSVVSALLPSYTLRDLKTEPAWTEADTGMPLPKTGHGCSMCLPTWDAVLGYEEKRDKVMRRLRAGYPRFLLHPATARLFAEADRALAGNGTRVVVFPRGMWLRGLSGLWRNAVARHPESPVTRACRR